jgi:hypothetical protein
LNAEAEFFSEEAAAAVRLVLSDMRGRDGSILRAVFLAEDKREEICRRFDVSAEYLGVVLYRAKERFRVAYRKKKKKK